MTLNELFTSYNQVFPVIFQSNDNEIYSNLNRAKSASNNWKTGQHSSDSQYRHWKTKVIPLNNYTKNIKYDINEDYNNFINELNNFINNNNQYEYLKDDITNIAKLESNFKQGVGNKKSSATGWFQFIDSTRESYSDMSKEDFINTPSEQLLTAAKHIETLRERIKKWGGDPNYFPNIYLAWWNEADAKKYIQTGILSKKDINGTTAENIFNKAKDLIDGKS